MFGLIPQWLLNFRNNKAKPLVDLSAGGGIAGQQRTIAILLR